MKPTIPRGWRRVMRGALRKTDRLWNYELLRFTEPCPYCIGATIGKGWTVVIRRVAGKGKK